MFKETVGAGQLAVEAHFVAEDIETVGDIGDGAHADEVVAGPIFIFGRFFPILALLLGFAGEVFI